MEFKLIIKKLNDTITEEENIQFESWYQESQRHRDYFEHVKNNYSDSINDIDIDKDAAWELLEEKIKASQNQTSSYWKYAVAAMVVILLSVPVFTKLLKESSSSQEFVTTKILPGVDKAILTLDDGTQIALENGANYEKENIVSNGEKIVYKSQAKKNNVVVYNTLSIPRGGEFSMELSDGTKVQLNSETQIKYPVNFIKGRTRQVELVYGEAYFEVSSSDENEGSKFFVLNNSQSIEVVGTKFNVKAYKDEDFIYTTLAEGKVQVESENGTFLLEPGEQTVFNTKTKEISKTITDVYAELAWIDGDFMFNKKPLLDIIKVLSRWYDVDFVIQGESIKHQKFNGQLSRKQNLEIILELIKTTEKLESYEIKGKTIILK
ncbi:DUF4974 domain-containing protein [Aestuariibaculum sp. M13]|uniref:FecR family protein n=1 Tax=Aestuariibaculum sp. M13 TaxID=2967132 RepID=UPI002159D5A0|nr:FecR family protein [Aestuariibaculum sp. M13]MCR8669020.1 DUF4974 domain-containing protein [Aestuariibaculum sp. M13]